MSGKYEQTSRQSSGGTKKKGGVRTRLGVYTESGEMMRKGKKKTEPWEHPVVQKWTALRRIKLLQCHPN